MAKTGSRIAALAVAALTVLGGMTACQPAPVVTLAQRQAILRQEVTSSSMFWNMYAHRTESPNNTFDWSTDLCSWSPDKPFGFDFTGPCRRHDFNYRNFKGTGIFDAGSKATIDSAFSADMKAECATHNAFTRPACLAAAAIYYEAAKQLGT